MSDDARRPAPSYNGDAFGVFWLAYPRHEARKDARKAWDQVGADDHVEAIHAALAWQVQSDSWVRGYVPLAASYLRGERWLDEPMRRPVTAQQTAEQDRRERLTAEYLAAYEKRQGGKR